MAFPVVPPEEYEFEVPEDPFPEPAAPPETPEPPTEPHPLPEATLVMMDGALLCESPREAEIVEEYERHVEAETISLCQSRRAVFGWDTMPYDFLAVSSP